MVGIESEMAEDKTIIELAPILHLPPVNKTQMVPYALMRYLNLLKEIYDEVPLDQLSDEDLTDDEKATFVEWIDLGAQWDGIPGPDEFSAGVETGMRTEKEK